VQARCGSEDRSCRPYALNPDLYTIMCVVRPDGEVNAGCTYRTSYSSLPERLKCSPCRVDSLAEATPRSRRSSDEWSANDQVVADLQGVATTPPFRRVSPGTVRSPLARMSTAKLICCEEATNISVARWIRMRDLARNLEA
jgi:hypothetical protein